MNMSISSESKNIAKITKKIYNCVYFIKVWFEYE